MSPKTIVITGGFGYIGGRIAQKFAENGLHVRISTRRELHRIPAWAIENPMVSWGHHLGELCQGADAVIHLAAPNEIFATNHPQQSIDETVALTQEALDVAVQSNVHRFIYFSTIHVYGAPLQGRYNEKTKPLPAHPYAVAHYQSEQMVNAAHTAGFQTLVLRLSNGFGAPADTFVDRWTLLVSDLCRQACVDRHMALTTPGHQLRDFIPLSDIVDATAYFATVEGQAWQYRTINLASGISQTVRQMAEDILAHAQQVISPDITLFIPETTETKTEASLLIEIDQLLNAGFRPKHQTGPEIKALLELCHDAFAL